MKHLSTLIAVLFAYLSLAAAPALAKEESKLPQTTKDGLELVKQDKLSAVYVKPGATLDAYDKVMLLDCFVAFEKDWQRNYNADHFDIDDRVTDKDMQRIKAGVAEQFKKVFTKELERGGYQVVTEAAQDVLLVRPAIINLNVTAPDLMTADMSRTFVAAAGSLTLYAELYDSVSSAKLAEVVDARVAGDDGMARIANRATNTQALDQALSYWAERLRKRLDQAHGKEK